MADTLQNKIFQAMEDPGIYPHRVQSVRQVQTHISKVFLTGDYVYKIKKAVDFGFLDFSTLAKRRKFCDLEIKLNRRLSNGIYLDLVPLTANAHSFSLGGPGNPVEYAVRMRQLEDGFSMDQLIAAERVSRLDMLALGQKLSEFYSQAAVSDLIDAGNAWETIYENCMENFRQTAESCDTVLNRDVWETVKGAVHSFLKHNKVLFERRAETGRVRDCHGDLRSEHIYFTGEGIQIIDCIEFKDALRHIDVISDLAFLLMDLDFRRHFKLGECVLEQFLEQSKDIESVRVLAFYKCYRAMVRCKVNCLFIGQVGAETDQDFKIGFEARQYLDLAFQYALQFFRPRVWVFCGLPASGKSTLAKALSNAMNCRLYRSDVVRKELFGLAPHESGTALFGEKIYSSLASSLTYGKMLCLAQEEINHGKSVILDATYSRQTSRDDLLEFSGEKGIKPVFIECCAPEEILRERLLTRELLPSVSDARIDHFKRLKARYERFRYAGNALHIRVDTSVSPVKSLCQILVRAFKIDTEPVIDVRTCQSDPEPVMA